MFYVMTALWSVMVNQPFGLLWQNKPKIHHAKKVWFFIIANSEYVNSPWCCPVIVIDVKYTYFLGGAKPSMQSTCQL